MDQNQEPQQEPRTSGQSSVSKLDDLAKFIEDETGEPCSADDILHVKFATNDTCLTRSFADAVAVLDAKWAEMQPGRYKTLTEDSEDESWMRGFSYAKEFLRDAMPAHTEAISQPLADDSLPSLRDLVGMFAEPKPKPEFTISADEEHYHGCFESIEDAIEEASQGCAYETFWVGECEQPRQPELYWNADDWLELVGCQDEYQGEYAEDWDDSTAEDHEELEEEVRKVMAEWLDRKKLRPKFFIVRDATKYIVRNGTVFKIGTDGEQETLAAIIKDRIENDEIVDFESSEICKCGNPSAFNSKTGKYIGCCDDCLPF